MKKWLWLGAMVLLQTLDVLITLRGGLANEANPFMVWFWSSYGFTACVVAKALHVGLFVIFFKVCTDLGLPRAKQIFNIGAGSILVMLTLLGIWNVYAISTF